MDVRTLFAKPKLLLYLPPGPLNKLTSWDFQTNRDYIVQGELLKFYLIVSFSRMLDTSSARKDGGRSSITSASIPNLTSPPMSPAPSSTTSGTASLPSSPIAGSVTEQYNNTSSTVYLQRIRDLFKRLKLAIRFQKISAESPSTSYIPVSAISKVVGYKDFSVLARPSNLERATPSATSSASSASSSTTPSPRSMIPSPMSSTGPINYDTEEPETQSDTDCILLDNGDFAFPLQVLVGLDDSFLNQRLTLVVTVSPAEKQLALDDILGVGLAAFMEKSPPIRFIGKQLYLYDPMAVKFDTKRLHQRYLISTTIENTHTDPIAVSNIQLHLTSVNNVKSSFSELAKFFRAEIILPPDVTLPLIIRNREKYDILITTDVFPVAPVDSIDLSALKPVLLIDWVNAACSSWLQSQYVVPFPDPVRHASLLLSFELFPSPVIHVHQKFNLQITVSNLKDYARNLSLEIPLPTHYTNISNHYQKLTRADAENPERRSTDGVVSATPEKCAVKVPLAA